MYFIARNNAIYNYIAHTSSRRRWMVTLLLVGAIFFIGIYGIYSFLFAQNMMLKSECMALQIKADEIVLYEKSGKDAFVFIASGKKSIADRAIASDKREQHCHDRMLFILDNIAKSGLTLTSYGSCKDIDKIWYTKDSAHFDVTGPMQKLMTFLETIEKSHRMIIITQTSITRVGSDSFQMGFDVGLITVKK